MKNSEYIFGLRAIIEALQAGKEIDKVLLRKELGGDLARELTQMLGQLEIPVQRVPLERLNRITMKNHQGAIAFLSPVGYHNIEQLIPSLYEEGKIPKIIILDGVTDTRNFGAIARTAECAGFDTIVLPQRGSVSVNADAIKTSAGALLHLPVCRVRSLASTVRFLQESGIRVVGASEKGAQLYTRTDFSGPTAIVMGAEDTGISDDVLRLCDSLVYIPIKGHIGSLNVSVAAGIMMYETVRQQSEATD